MAFSLEDRFRVRQNWVLGTVLLSSIELAVAGCETLKHHLVWGQTVPIEIGIRAQPEGHQDVVMNKGTVNFMREQANIAV